MSEHQFNKKIKTVQCDGGGEYKGLLKLAKDSGFQLRISCPYNKHKLQYHTTKCAFLGYSSSHKGYKCMNSSGRIFISRHVIFNEDDFPFEHGFLNTKKHVETLTKPACFFYPPSSAGTFIEEEPRAPQESNSATSCSMIKVRPRIGVAVITLLLAHIQFQIKQLKSNNLAPQSK